jgi:hypothetical protein
MPPPNKPILDIDYDRLFGRSPSAAKDQADSLQRLRANVSPPFEIDYDRLFGRTQGPRESADVLMKGIIADAIAPSLDPNVSEYDSSVFAPRPKTFEPTHFPIEELTGVDKAMRGFAEALAGEGARRGETRVEKLERQAREYAVSPEKRAFDLENRASITAAPTGLALARQKLASLRLFTDRSIVEFDNGNSSGFHIGVPFAHPMETAKQIAYGIPKFVGDLVAHPAKLFIQGGTGGQYLLPEEQRHVIRESIANTAALAMGDAAGAVFKEMYVGRELLKAGVGAAERAGVQTTIGELEAIASTARRAAVIESTVRGQIATGIVQGAVGGATAGFILGETPEERRNMAATYAIMALPAGIAFEGMMGIFRKQQLGYHGASAAHAFELSVMRQMQDAATQSERNANNSFLALRSTSDLAEAARRADIDRPVVVQGVESYQPDGTEIVHTRPDGKKDVAFGVQAELTRPPQPGDLTFIPDPVDARPAQVEEPRRYTELTDESLEVVIATNSARLETRTDPADVAELTDLVNALKREREIRRQERGEPPHPDNIVAMQSTRPPSGMSPEYIAMNDVRQSDISARALQMAQIYGRGIREGLPDDVLDGMRDVMHEIQEEFKELPMDYRQFQVRRRRQAVEIALERYRTIRKTQPRGSLEAQTAKYEYQRRLTDLDQAHVDYNVGKPGASEERLAFNKLYEDAGIKWIPPRQPEYHFTRDPKVIAKLKELQDHFDERTRQRNIERMLEPPEELTKPRSVEEFVEFLQEHARKNMPRDQIIRELADLIPDKDLEAYFDPGPNIMGSVEVDEYLHHAFFEKQKQGRIAKDDEFPPDEDAGPDDVGFISFQRTGERGQPPDYTNAKEAWKNPENRDELLSHAREQGYAVQRYGDYLKMDFDALPLNLKTWVANTVQRFLDEGPISFAKTGEGKVGASLDRSLLKKLGANLYKDNLPSVVVKEGIQNAVDAIRPVSGGVVSVDLRRANEGIFIFKDTGVGMDPETAANEFMDVGGSKKPSGASGGYGLAKVGLLASARHFKMVTVAQTKEGMKMTTIEGSSDDWVNGTLEYKVTTPQNKEIETGTQLQIELESTASADVYSAEKFLDRVIRFSRGKAALVEKRLGQYDTEIIREPVVPGIETQLPNAKVEILHSPNREELGPYSGLLIHVLNNGLYQFTMTQPARGVVPKFITVDVMPRRPSGKEVTVTESDYPFTTSREELKSGVDTFVKEYLKDLSITAARDEAIGLIQTLRESPAIPNSTKGARLMDTSRKLPKELFNHVLKDPSLARLADTFAEALPAFALMIEAKREQLIGASRTFLNWTNGGIGIGKGYLGLNISSSGLNQVAQAAGIPDTGIKNNVILINPYEIYGEMLRAEADNPDPAVTLAERLADHTVGTLVHELIHESARGHDESFSGLLTRSLGIVLKEGIGVHAQLKNAWALALSVQNKTGTSFTFEETYKLLRKEWEGNRDNAFKSISSDLAPTEGDAGGPKRGDEGGDELQPLGTDPKVVRGARDKPSPIISGSSQLGPVAGAEPTVEPPGVIEGRRRHAIATFEVGGYFPNEIVSFLGNDYTYVQPVLGKTGALEGHIIRDGDGNKVEVKWDAIRHGPDMAVNSFLFDKPAARKAIADDFERWINAAGQKLASQPFGEQVAAYVANKNYNKAMISPLMSFLSDEYGRRLREAALPPTERAAYERVARDVKKYRETSGRDLVDLASSNGMYIERQNGALIIRDSENGAYLGLAHSPEEAIQFVQGVIQDRGADMTPGGVPPGVARHLLPPPPPPGGPHGTAWNPREGGWLSDIRDLFSVSGFGTRFTGMRQVMVALDNQIGTNFFAELYQPLQQSHQRKFAAMHKDMMRLAETAKLSRGLNAAQMDQITMSIETMAPDDMVRAGGLMNRPYSPRELAGARWFIDNQVDVRKAFQYYRAVKTLEQKKRFQTLPLPEKTEAVRRVQASLAADEATIEGARIMGAVLRANKPGELSLYAIVRLAEATMGGHVSPQDYIDKHFPLESTSEGRQMRVVRDEVTSHFRDLANTFDIPDEQRLGGYFAHLRNYANDEIIAGRDGAPIFTSELLRTGEMNEYERDPINVLSRYINAGFSSKFTKDALDNAYKYLNITTAKMTDPAHGAYVNQLLKENYIDELRGIPHASTSFFDKIFNGILDRLHVASDINVRRDIVNTFLSLSSSATIGFRPMQGIRDFNNFTSIYYSRFGAERMASLLSIMARVTPDDLVKAGIIKSKVPGEGTGAALSREGVIPTLAPVSVLSAQERLQNSIAARSAPYREFIQNVANQGIKWGLQHSVYQWAHAASYLETATRAGDELTKLSAGEYGTGIEAKQKAYKNLFINSYDPPVAAYFDRLVTAGKFKEAIDFLGRATAFETVSTFGLANHPAGWGTNTGRVLGQYGNWPVWARTMLARLLTRGTPTERAGAAARYGMTQGALAAASIALGLNLSSWYLPGAGPAFSATRHLGLAAQSYDEEQTDELQKAAAAIVLGVPGSMMFRGGPAFSILGRAAAAAQGYPQAEREAVSTLFQAPMLGVPGSYLLRDIYRANEMAQYGNNPVTVWLQALGIPSTEEPSILNPGGAELPD